MKFPQPIGGIR